MTETFKIIQFSSLPYLTLPTEHFPSSGSPWLCSMRFNLMPYKATHFKILQTSVMFNIALKPYWFCSSATKMNSSFLDSSWIWYFKTPCFQSLFSTATDSYFWMGFFGIFWIEQKTGILKPASWHHAEYRTH